MPIGGWRPAGVGRPDCPLGELGFLDCLVDQYEQGVGVVWLADIVAAAGRAAVADDVGTLHAAEDDDRDVAGGWVVDQLLADGQAARVGQAQVQEHEIRMMGGSESEAVVPGVGLVGREALLGETDRQDVGRSIIVFDDQHRTGWFCGVDTVDLFERRLLHDGHIRE